MAVRGVEHQYVRLSLQQSAGSVKHVGSNSNRSAAEESVACVARGVRVLYALLDILDRDKSLEETVLVNQRELLDLVLSEDLLSLLEISADRSGNEVILCHYLADLLVVIGDEAEVAVSEDTDQLAVLNDRNTGDLVLAHQSVRVKYAVLRGEEERVNDNAVFRTLYLVHLVDLLLDGHVLVDNTDTAFSGNRDSHAALCYGIHRGSHDRGVERDVLGELRLEVDHVRGNVALCGYEQHVVERKTFLDKFLVVVAVQHTIKSSLSRSVSDLHRYSCVFFIFWNISLNKEKSR